MKKTLKGLACAGLCCAMLTTTLATAACGGSKLDTETRQLQLSTAALDGNFNPFFYTSATDGNILSMTQISMLSIDKQGQIKVGYDEACAVAYYNETMYDAAGKPTTQGDENGKTVYEFVLKNGLKFSNGSDLTIHDVLFNLYVYLDPSYSGSSTLYSTNIVGLKAYRAQDENVSDDDEINIDSEYNAAAMNRINAILDWVEDSSETETVPADPNIASDVETTYKLFKEEITSDWTTIETSWRESYKNTHRFTEAWQAYLFNEGIIKVQTGPMGNSLHAQLYEDKNNNGKRDDGELYYTTLDPQQPGADGGNEGEILGQDYADMVAAASTEEKITEYINSVTGTKPSRELAKMELQKKCCLDIVYQNYHDKSSLDDILLSWATGSNVLVQFANEARSQHYEDLKQNGELPVPTVKGITTYVTSGTFKDKAKGEVSLGEEHYVLRVEVNGIDPKAVYNFGFAVAPMYYYSTTDYKGKNYVQEAMNDNGGKALNGAQITHFGIEMGDAAFFDDVLKATEKNKLPVGAGAYQTATASGGDATDGNTFFENNVVYFKRNENFHTLGGGKEGGVQNAKIKYVNYKVMADDKIMEALTTKAIDYGTPNATTTNVATVTGNNFLGFARYLTGGYGYIGINPKYVPEYKVRQAIMKSLNTSAIISNYYGGTGAGLAQVIYRPMSLTSWAYPKDSSGKNIGEYAGVAYDPNLEDVKALIQQAGYEKVDGVYTKTTQVDGMANAANGTKLKLTFTIAGQTTDHPTYKLFVDTAKQLNDIGFDITVTTDIQALKKMNTGNLAVWAAAWSAATDPDLYQVYHMDSKATSVKNWNYPNILNAPDTWSYEMNVIESLSDLIMKARSYSKQSDRAPVYAQCLDKIMELYVEMPTYQRQDLCVYNKEVIDANSLVKDPNNYIGLFDRIWDINYV